MYPDTNFSAVPNLTFFVNLDVREGFRSVVVFGERLPSQMCRSQFVDVQRMLTVAR